jgi:hypothetical protein
MCAFVIAGNSLSIYQMVSFISIYISHAGNKWFWVLTNQPNWFGFPSLKFCCQFLNLNSLDLNTSLAIARLPWCIALLCIINFYAEMFCGENFKSFNLSSLCLQMSFPGNCLISFLYNARADGTLYYFGSRIV